MKIHDIISKNNSKKYATGVGNRAHQTLEFLDINSNSGLAQKIRANPEISIFFAPDSKAEVPIAGLINGKFTSIRIDRMMVQGDNVLFVDFKSDSTRARRDEYIQKMRLYRELLARAYPHHNIIAHILWLKDFSLEKID